MIRVRQLIPVKKDYSIIIVQWGAEKTLQEHNIQVSVLRKV